uniref:Organic solute transporter alpha-like protein n=1 Tax=Caenorhabditis japonica TaxID=281687 RepID=A0A8R1HPI6_CAEJA
MLEISPWETLVKLLTDSLLNCTGAHDDVPHSKTFLRSLPATYIASLAVATAVSMGTLCLTVLHFVYIYFYITHSGRRLQIVLLACTAPLVSILALVAMYMPRVWFLAHLLSFLYFSFALWVIICLLLHIFGGHRALVAKMMQHLQYVEIATPPFCCLFPCLPKVRLEGKKIRWCEWMVMQAPVVRLFATLISLVIYFEYQDKGLVPLKVLDFVTLPSLLAGIYGTHMLVTTVSRMDELMSYRYIVVFRLLDFFFMVFGLQQPVFDFLARYGAFGCGTVLPAIETSFYWKNFFTVMEAFCVTLISTVLLQPSKSSFFDKHPSCRSMSSARSTITDVDTDESTT